MQKLDLKVSSLLKDEGKVISVNNNLVKVFGLKNCFMGERVLFNNKISGKIIELAEITTIFAFDQVNVGDSVKGTGEEFLIKIGKNQKILNGLGIGDITDGEYFSLNSTKKFSDIGNITEMINTGVLAVDLLFPVGKGQRVLIMGDNKTGKSTFCLNTILNNSNDPKFFFIYVSISQSKNFNNRLKDFFKDIKNSLLIIAEASDNIAERYYAPFVGMRLAEYWRDLSFDVFLVIDDLTKHSIICREIALLNNKNVGREAFPTEIFTEHANLLEKAGKKLNSGSITCFPIVSSSDLSDYIPTNLISITDGQIIFNNQIKRWPMIDTSLSVTRIGGLLPNQLKNNFLTILKRYKEYERLKEIGGSLSKELEELVKNGISLESVFNQEYRLYKTWELVLTVDLFKNYDKSKLTEYVKYYKYFANIPLEKSSRLISILGDING